MSKAKDAKALAEAWKQYRNDTPLSVVSGTNAPKMIKGESCGHNCPKCGHELTWNNGGEMIWSSYTAYCRPCTCQFENMPGKYIMSIVKQQLGDAVVIPEDKLDDDDNDSLEVQPAKTVTVQFKPVTQVKQIVTASGSSIECRTCGTSFERPIRRGRPPVECEDCIAKKGSATTVKAEPKRVTINFESPSTPAPTPSSSDVIVCRDCRTEFPRPIRRGRPPVKCDDCQAKG